ncbi:P-loop containing nucleoside triphosphate hydrolase protein, partial [Rhizophagus irregularis]
LDDLNKESEIEVDNPFYTRAPEFQFDLSVLCKNKEQSLKLNVADASTHDEVAINVANYSKLDETQAKALIFALTREIALIEGPPGTGKTVVGVEIMKVLLAKENRRTKIGPILTICFTNHALDQFLEHLLDENIKNIVRLGARTKSERIKDFNLEVLSKNHAHNNKMSYLIAKLHSELESIEDAVNDMTIRRWMKWDDIREYLMIEENSFYKKFTRVISSDLPKSDDELQIDYTTQWIENYNEPKSDRPLSVLLNDYSIWQMSRSERHRLHDYWRVKVHNEFVEKSSKLQKRHEKKRKELNNIYDIESRQILLESDVIGVTTNGAAKYQDLIRSIDPKIIICEEAGEVLEAHILSALTPSTQHLILIGDHNQLRPHISTFSLGMDSKTGRNYQLDKSLFERLVNGDRASKVEKSQLLTQRRMRKGEISDLIRYTLYPNLIDGENTAKYPNVCGAQHNVYFIDHRHPEDNSDSDLAIQSHVNTYEVKMVVEMVKYFVRNGYTKPEDIAVLTPYLGQMMKIKEALAKSFVVVIDERDAQNIIEMEEEQKENESNKKGKDSIVKNTNVATTKSLNHQVTLRTVDNFQGEEANIVIVSLVRNVSKSGDYDSIGFLKSSNRSNVLLSRAREGMYLIGNSEMMATKSEDVWAPVINMLKTRNPPQIGFGMPIVCNQHPDYKNIITESEQFERFSPDGGCYKKCQFMLNCGHACTYKCHSDDPKHIGIKCFQPCRKLQPDCSHPCPKQCFETCGRCNHLIGKVKLPCNHEIQNGRCWQNQDKETLYCKELVTKKLLNCEHYKEIRVRNFLYTSVKNVECREKCKELLKCGHECLNECSECQKYSILPENSKNENKVENIKEFKRNQHGKCKHICERLLFCGHICKQYCHEGNDCPPCENKCTVSCEHAACNKNCAEPCVVCAEKCLWKCKHQGKCELSCGAPCYRLPCNKRCDKKFECGHRCAGICGETCPSNDFCVNCASEKVKDQVPDVIMGTKFSEIDWNEERMVVLSCGHVYTMETMDMLVKMEEYYEGSIERGWTSIKALPTSSKDIIKCPACRAPVKNIRRYGRIINKYTLDVQNKKFLNKYSHELNEITKQVIIHEEEMRN